MRVTRINIAKADIISLFEGLPKRVHKHSDIRQTLSDNRGFWRLAMSTTVNAFISFLLDETKLKKLRLDFPHRTEIRYTWGDVSTYELALSLRPNCYYTHYTAVYLHELTDQVPKTIYLNHEQPPKRHRDSDLDQARIDMAFRRPVRISKNIAGYDDQRICLLNGMHTGGTGVVEIRGRVGETIRVTNVERTLIDITVRPVYAGGVFEVLKAYRLAKDKVSVNKLAATLVKLNYIYPYHQAVGFYLEKAGVYKQSLIDLVHRFEKKFDFYLVHNMKDVDYSKQWRLFFPKGF